MIKSTKDADTAKRDAEKTEAMTANFNASTQLILAKARLVNAWATIAEKVATEVCEIASQAMRSHLK